MGTSSPSPRSTATAARASSTTSRWFAGTCAATRSTTCPWARLRAASFASSTSARCPSPAPTRPASTATPAVVPSHTLGRSPSSRSTTRSRLPLMPYQVIEAVMEKEAEIEEEIAQNHKNADGPITSEEIKSEFAEIEKEEGLAGKQAEELELAREAA